MADVKLIIEGEATKVRNGLHAFGTAHPFTFAFVAAVIVGAIVHFVLH